MDIILYNIKYKLKWIYDFSFYSFIFITSYNFETSANENKVSVGLSKETKLLKILQWKDILYFKHGFINIFSKVHLGNISHFIWATEHHLQWYIQIKRWSHNLKEMWGIIFFRGKTPNTLIEVKREVRKTTNLMTSSMSSHHLTFPVVPTLSWSLEVSHVFDDLGDVSYGNRWKKTKQEKKSLQRRNDTLRLETVWE